MGTGPLGRLVSGMLGRPKIEPFKNYDFIVLYSLYREDKIKFVEMDFLVGRNFVISNHWRKIPSFEHLQNDTLRLETLMGKGMDFLLHHLIDVEVDNYTTIISSYDNEIEQIESRTMYRPSPYSLKRLFQIKRQLLRVKKVAGPEREILSQLTKGSYDYISDDSIAYFRDIYDHVVRVYDQIDNYREVISSILEVHLSVTSNKLNETMKVLTVIATIMMPITAIGAIYGMNFRNMPELEWKYGYFLILAVMLAVTVAMIWYMKKKGWY